MVIKGEQRIKVNQIVGADLERLYGPLDKAIEYLKEMADEHKGTDISLYENWTGYEDMEMSFSFTRSETDKEYNDRQAKEKKFLKDKADEEAKKKHNENVLAQIARLKEKLK